jgi:hypothetical protein
LSGFIFEMTTDFIHLATHFLMNLNFVCSSKLIL